MQPMKNITLLTPAVLNCSALEYLQEKDQKFHKKYVFKFGLMQALWAVILYVVCVGLFVIPGVKEVRETGTQVITNALFNEVKIQEGQMEIDIKPAIWYFSFYNEPTKQKLIAVDSLGSMNKFFWDDRVEKGVVKKIDGIGFMKEYVYVKKGTWTKKIPYSKFVSSDEVTVTKGEIYDKFMQMTESNRVLVWSLALIPLVFLLGLLFGMLLHVLFAATVGLFLALMTRDVTKNLTLAGKVSSGLYVGWAYILVLAVITQKLLALTFGNLSDFYLAIKAVAFLAIVLVGYLCFKQVRKNKMMPPSHDSNP